MLLGVYAFENYRGLRITGVIPGYSAHGRLRAHDVLLRVSDGDAIYPVRTHAQIEHAKDEIGPYREAVLEFYRPRQGVKYMWVTFVPVDEGPHLHAAAPRARAEFKTEDEQPGASDFFHKASPRQGRPGVRRSVTLP